VESRLADCGLGLVAGIDEVGRGTLAGPVVASAVILRHDRVPSGIRDSKQLTEKARVRLFGEIQASAVAIGIGVVSSKVIDRDNIVAATLLAMTEAVLSLGVRPDCVVVDGRDVPDLAVPAIGIVKGDIRCVSVAAASIIAKVTRDGMMTDVDAVYPAYGFARHKGYATREHLAALRAHGPSKIHRMSFEPVAVLAGARIAE
jgi:ribonuclease HII